MHGRTRHPSRAGKRNTVCQQWACSMWRIQRKRRSDPTLARHGDQLILSPPQGPTLYIYSCIAMFSLFASEKPQPKAAEVAIQKISNISATHLSRFERLPKVQRYAIIGAASVGGVSLLYALTRSSKSARRPPIPSPRDSLLPDLSPEDAADLPYHPAALPGARDVDSPWGTIRVYEFGPRDGEKVLLIHGISTPSIALTDLAHKLVGRGRRVMLFGGSSLLSLLVFATTSLLWLFQGLETHNILGLDVWYMLFLHGFHDRHICIPHVEPGVKPCHGPCYFTRFGKGPGSPT
jgi:hypothetical protein